MEDQAKIALNRKHIDTWFKDRFVKERRLTQYQGVIQGSHVKVDFSGFRTRVWKGVDELMVIAILPESNSFIGMAGSMRIVEAPLSVICKEGAE